MTRPNPPVLALDLDGVVVDLTTEIIRRLVDEGHPAPNWTNPPTFSWKDSACGLTVEAGIRAHELFDSVEPYLTAPALTGAVEAVKEILAAGWRVVVVTQRPHEARVATHNWLSRHGLGKLPVTITGAKAELAVRNGYTIAIDDAGHHIAAYRMAGVPCIAWDAPYNRDARAMFRATDWSDVLWALGGIQAAIDARRGRQDNGMVCGAISGRFGSVEATSGDFGGI